MKIAEDHAWTGRSGRMRGAVLLAPSYKALIRICYGLEFKGWSPKLQLPQPPGIPLSDKHASSSLWLLILA